MAPTTSVAAHPTWSSISCKCLGMDGIDPVFSDLPFIYSAVVVPSEHAPTPKRVSYFNLYYPADLEVQ